jgi:signal transduction histidine kinase
MKPLDVRSLLDEVLDIVSSRITPAIRLCKEYQEVPLIRADRAQVQRAFMNLIENALQSMVHGGELLVSARCSCADDGTSERNTVVVEIADSGRGITDEHLPKIFDLAFSTKREGYGLGLYIVKQIVGSHSGTISVKTALGKGTTFTLRFPAEETA